MSAFADIPYGELDCICNEGEIANGHLFSCPSRKRAAALKPLAALFVATGGTYFKLEGVDPWDVERDARKYEGPHPVVAHPPCERWGRYWHGGPSVKVRKVLGDDNGCFKAALTAVRQFGGVIEHPQASHAWRHFGIVTPPFRGGWVPADDLGGYTCCVEQGHYGHRARKATWLYVFGVPRERLPELVWGPSEAEIRLDLGYHSKAERDAGKAQLAAVNPESAGKDRRASRTGAVQRMAKRERTATPRAFRDVLLSLAWLVDVEAVARARRHGRLEW